MDNRIAITGMACRYADASTTNELWTNVLAQRRAFRRFPVERLNLLDYWSNDAKAVDSIYCTRGAFLADYHFDRIRYRIASDIYRTADMVHWLALDVATEAMADAGFRDGEGLPKDVTGVYIGNTLTGEFSRASILRQRWPYVRKILTNVLQQQDWNSDSIQQLLGKMEPVYKSPFPTPGSESLAGGLANTIAGRICNYFNLKGGGYLLDGACSSSILAVIEGCNSILAGDIRVAIVGGVDLSLDPFELVGFSRAGALAKDLMRVFDAQPTGFIPGEGCGFIVLERYEEARAAGRRIYGVVRGWGISSDGAGGLTRPESEGQRLALSRAYRRAGFPISEVDYFEAHGTGTELGDTVELKALISERIAQGAKKAAVIGSIKALIGHTKAAAGIAGLIKTTLSIWNRVLPPTAGCVDPHPELREHNSVLRVTQVPEAWVSDTPLRAAVSAMGFGGINAHLVIEETPERYDQRPSGVTLPQLIAPDCELIVMSASTHEELLEFVHALMKWVPGISFAEISDLAAKLMQTPPKAIRAGLVASSPEELQARLQLLLQHLQQCLTDPLKNKLDRHIDTVNHIFLGSDRDARIGLLFSGQASPVRRDSGALGRLFDRVRDMYSMLEIPRGEDTDTSVAQPMIVAASLAGVMALEELGVHAKLGLGHSVGEIGALCWSGAFSVDTALAIAAERGRLMSLTPHGSMISVGAPDEIVRLICANDKVEIAAINSARQTVLSGDPLAIRAAKQKAQARGWQVTDLPVSHAFHSRHMNTVIEPLGKFLSTLSLGSPQHNVLSTVRGEFLLHNENLCALLVDQLTQPVLFTQALDRATTQGLDLLIEVGPGAILSGLSSTQTEVPALTLDSCSASYQNLFEVTAAAFALGATVNFEKLLSRRICKTIEIGKPHSFLANPCEMISHSGVFQPTSVLVRDPEVQEPESEPHLVEVSTTSPVQVLRELIATATDLPLEQILETDRMLDHLRLNSILVAEIAARASKALNRPPLKSPTTFSNASVAQLAEAIASAEKSADALPDSQDLPGIAGWVRCFTTEYLPAPSLSEPIPASGVSDWKLHLAADHPFKDELMQTFARPGNGVVFCVPPDDQGESLPALLDVVQKIAKSDRLICVNHQGGYSAFLRSVAQERPDLSIAIISLPPSLGFADLAYAEASQLSGFVDVQYDLAGNRFIPHLQLRPVEETPYRRSSDPSLSELDLLLVTGGAKGIGAESALALARGTGVRLILLGRSDSKQDEEVSRNLARFAAAGINANYVSCDITDAQTVAEVIAKIQLKYGSITGLLHAAGHNNPIMLSELTPEILQRTLAPKVQGFKNLLSVLDATQLRLCIVYGSIIGRIGMRGNADYAFANEQLRLCVERASAHFNTCRFLTLEWSMWSGVGMAERLNSVETLAREGFSTISPEMGTHLLENILAVQNLSGSLVVTARFAALPHLSLAGEQLPLLRFLEHPLRFIPGIELIAESTLHVDTDLYLRDHVLKGSLLLPGVMVIEAMAQAAQALGLNSDEMTIEELHFDNPILVPEDRGIKVRLLALRENSGAIHMAIRSETTDFQADHARALILPTKDKTRLPNLEINLPRQGLCEHTPDSVYDSILFQSGRFRRIIRYEALTALECRARLGSSTERWFSPFLPSTFLCGDPGVRDAMMHAIQACVPSQMIVPVSVQLIRRWEHRKMAQWVVNAREIDRTERTFTYDIDLMSEDGVVVEQWRGAVFAALEVTPVEQFIHQPLLLGPYLQRRVTDHFSAKGIDLAVEIETQECRSEHLLQRISCEGDVVLRRTDHKPELYNTSNGSRRSITMSNIEGLSLAVCGALPVGCDVEWVRERETSVWSSMLGEERFAYVRYLIRERSIDLGQAATRIWCLQEALKKTGFDEPAVIRISSAARDGWMEFECGQATVLSWSAQTNEQALVLAVAVINQSKGGHELVDLAPESR